MPKGQKHTTKTIAQVLAMLAKKRPRAEIAEKTGVCAATVAQLAQGKHSSQRAR